MPRLVNGKPIRERGGRKDRPSRSEYLPPEFRPREDYPHGHPMSYEPKDTAPSSTAALEHTAAAMWECTEKIERPETHIAPRKSVTDAQHLGLNRPVIETEPRRAKQLLTPAKVRKMFPGSDWNPTTTVRVQVRKPVDPKNPNLGTKIVTELHMIDGALVTTTDERVTFQGPKTLLKRGTPTVKLEGKFKRQEAYTKRIATVRDECPLPEGLGPGMIVTTEHESLDLDYLGINTGEDIE